MDIVEFVTFLIQNMVSDSDAVRVQQYDDEDFITVEVLVDKEDIGKVIGKNGATANSIRTLVQTVAYVHQMKKVKINFDSF